MFISNDRFDFGSILTFIEKNFSTPLGIQNFADARSIGDLSDFFTLGPASAKKFQKLKAPKQASFFLHDKSPQTDPDDEIGPSARAAAAPEWHGSRRTSASPKARLLDAL